MNKIDVAIQSFKKPESLVYTLLSLKKYCGDIIDTIYINDDCSDKGTIEHYLEKRLTDILQPIKIKVRINSKPSGYTHTLLTRDMLVKKSIKYKIQLLGNFAIKRVKWYSTTDDIRYQWAINNTDKRYIFLIHDDIKFYDNVAKLYLDCIKQDNKLAIVGDLGGSNRCPFGPCGKTCNPEKINNGIFPDKKWPVTGKKTILHTLIGRYNRNCRINEWCCLIDVNKAKELAQKEGTYFGNYEGGGDVGTFWFDRIIKMGYKFIDPLPTKKERIKYYEHWWQGHMGHSVWVNQGQGIALYEKEYIIECLYKEFGYKYV